MTRRRRLAFNSNIHKQIVRHGSWQCMQVFQMRFSAASREQACFWGTSRGRDRCSHVRRGL